MLTAKPHPLAHALFKAYLPWLFRNGLHGIYILREPDLKAVLGKPLLITPNHTSWWDGLLMYHLNTLLIRRRFNVMMLENQLRTLPFFRRLGCFGVNKKSPASVRASLRYMNQVLQDKANMLVIFPQGSIQPNTDSPLSLKLGIKSLEVSTDAQIIPLYIQYESLNNQRLTVFLSFGDAISFKDYKANTELLIQALAELRRHSYRMLEVPNYGRRLAGRKMIPIEG
jgi:1-acyl-sn-glycerol-3-phosphate acyltransferase